VTSTFFQRSLQGVRGPGKSVIRQLQDEDPS
jgi:hypothetical protein